MTPKTMLLIALTLVLVSFPASAKASTITATFAYDFTGGVACSATVTTNCYQQFEIGILVGAALSTQAVVPMPALAVPSGPVANITGGFSFAGGFGTQTVAVIVVAKDSTGARVTSDPTKASATVIVIPGAPTSVKLTIQ